MAFHIHILLDTLAPASFWLTKILNVFKKVDSREESGQYLRAFAKKKWLSFRLWLAFYCSLKKM